MNVLLLVLAGTALLSAAPAADIEPRQLIIRTAEEYRRAAAASTFAARIRQFGQAGERWAANEKSFRVSKSGERARLEFRPNGTVWNIARGRAILYLASNRQYLETEETSEAGKRIRTQLEHWYRILAGRFAMLASVDAELRLLKWEVLKAGGNRIRCAVIAIVPTEKSLGWTQRLWIDPETALVWKSVMRLPAARDDTSELMATEETVVWDDIRIGPVPDEVFSFTPPPGFRVLEIVPNLF